MQSIDDAVVEIDILGWMVGVIFVFGKVWISFSCSSNNSSTLQDLYFPSLVSTAMFEGSRHHLEPTNGMKAHNIKTEQAKILHCVPVLLTRGKNQI